MARQRQHTDGALTIPQVCEHLNVTRHTVYGLIERGEIAAFLIGKRYRVEPQALRRYKDRHRAPTRGGDHGEVGVGCERAAGAGGA